MIEKTPIVQQVGQITKCAAFRAARAISDKHQCRGAASSLGRVFFRIREGLRHTAVCLNVADGLEMVYQSVCPRTLF